MTKTSPLLNQLLRQESIVEEPWGDAILCQPYETEQILLAENASCIAVKALLNMLNLPYETKTYPNAEFMSPGGHRTKLPILKLGAFVVSEFEPIVNFVETKSLSLSTMIDEDVKLELRSHFCLAESILTNAELYISWLDESVYNGITCPRYGSVYPWPLNIIQCIRKRQEVKKLLHVFEWDKKTLDEVTEDVGHLCQTLTLLLGDKQFFYGDEPTELDALVFGHIFTILTTELPNNILAEKVNQFSKLVKLVRRIEQIYFKQLKRELLHD